MEVHQHPEKKYYLATDEDRCKGCGLCIAFCPKDCLGFSEEINEKGWRVAKVYHMEDCIKCYTCERMCPDFAIFVREEEDIKNEGDRQ
ncbi:MAG: 4Fe-4S dicluster domain-containing protein [Candidatus Heimdallarchaeota archaeon]|nr:4Fe-4S dicluster domain-containing protein [Candidatus Heimdallarchaeota archaeon]